MTEPPAEGTAPGEPSDPETSSEHRQARMGAPSLAHAEYWRRNIRYVGMLLVVWFVVSYGLGIMLVEPLNAVTVPGTGFPLGFWVAQQGSIYVFVVLIFVYVVLMNRLDRDFDVDEGDDV